MRKFEIRNQQRSNRFHIFQDNIDCREMKNLLED